MKLQNKIGRIISITFFGLLLDYKIHETFKEDFFLDALILGPIALVGIIIFIINIKKDVKEYSVSKNILSYLSTMIGSAFIVLTIGLCLYQYQRVNSPTLLSAFNDGGFNGFSMDFKKNGNYIFANGSGLGQFYFYGTYTIQDSIITLDKSEIDNVVKTNKLLIRENASYHNYPNELYLLQLDKNGMVTEKDEAFLVTRDNRKK